VRINGADLRVKVVGRGRQPRHDPGRPHRVRPGGAGGPHGKINTDAIDNSAGVDTSDHEVNIKILLGQVERRAA
jgi:glutamate dehydrogenase